MLPWWRGDIGSELFRFGCYVETEQAAVPQVTKHSCALAFPYNMMGNRETGEPKPPKLAGWMAGRVDDMLQ